MNTVRVLIDNPTTFGMTDANLVDGIKRGFTRWIEEARSYGFRPAVEYVFVDGPPFDHRVMSKTIYIKGQHYRGLADLPGKNIWVHNGIAPPGTHNGSGTKRFKPLTTVNQVSKIVRHESGHNKGLKHSNSESCAMHSNSSTETICRSEAESYVKWYGEEDTPKLPDLIPAGTALKALNVVEVAKGSLVLESGQRVFLRGHRIVISGGSVIVHEPPAKQRNITPVAVPCCPVSLS